MSTNYGPGKYPAGDLIQGQRRIERWITADGLGTFDESEADPERTLSFWVGIVTSQKTDSEEYACSHRHESEEDSRTCKTTTRWFRDHQTVAK